MHDADGTSEETQMGVSTSMGGMTVGVTFAEDDNTTDTVVSVEVTVTHQGTTIAQTVHQVANCLYEQLQQLTLAVSMAMNNKNTKL